MQIWVAGAGVDMARGCRLNAVSPSLITETAAKSGLPTEGTLSAEKCASEYLGLIFGDMSGVVRAAGSLPSQREA